MSAPNASAIMAPGLFAVSVAQADFMMVHLQGDSQAAEIAFSSAKSLRDLVEKGNAQLAGEIGDALKEMREMILEMQDSSAIGR